MTELLDTNVILRYLVGDNESQQKQAESIFKDAQKGKRKIYIKAVVIAESCFVLESFYKKTREEIAKSMEIFLSQKWFKVEDRQVLLSMWRYFKQNMHFVDSYLLALAATDKFKVITFDKELNKQLEANN